MDDKLEIPKRFRAIRKRFGLNQREMAERLGKTQTSISQIEGGYYGIALDTLVALETNLNVNREWLLRGNGDMLLSESGSEKALSDKTAKGEVIEELKAAYEKVIELKDSLIAAKDAAIADYRERERWYQEQLSKPSAA